MASPVDQRAEQRSRGVDEGAVRELFAVADAALGSLGAGPASSLVVPVERGWLVAVRQGTAVAADTVATRDDATLARYVLSRRLKEER